MESEARRAQKSLLGEKIKEQAELLRKEYSTWFLVQSANFLQQLAAKNFNPTWGFEVQADHSQQFPTEKMKNRDIFTGVDIGGWQVLAFDQQSQQILA